MKNPAEERLAGVLRELGVPLPLGLVAVQTGVSRYVVELLRRERVEWREKEGMRCWEVAQGAYGVTDAELWEGDWERLVQLVGERRQAALFGLAEYLEASAAEACGEGGPAGWVCVIRRGGWLEESVASFGNGVGVRIECWFAWEVGPDHVITGHVAQADSQGVGGESAEAE